MGSRKNEAYWAPSADRWQIKVQLDGERRTFTCSTPGKKGKVECEKKADAWLTNHLKGENTPCGVLLDQYLESVETTTSQANFRKVSAYVDNYIRPAIGRKKICQITELDLQKIIDYAYRHPAAKWCQDGLSLKTLSSIRATIMAWLKFSRKANVTNLRPESLTIPSKAKRSNKTILPLEDLLTLFRSDSTTYYGKPRTDWYIHAYRIAVLTGMRPGELLGLQWGDIKNNTITIHRSINDDDEITSGKNANAKRSIAVTPMIAAELEKQKEQLSQAGIKLKWVFPDWEGLPSRQQTYRKEWYRYRDCHGMEQKITPYELRHTFISICDDMPLSLKQKVVGHSKNMDTEGVYGHLKQGDIERAGAYSEAAFRRLICEEKSENGVLTVPT